MTFSSRECQRCRGNFYDEWGMVFLMVTPERVARRFADLLGADSP